MFLNDLFKVTSIDFTAETISADISIDADHKIFEGHFPGSPVTPGVVQLQIVKEILEQQLKRKLRMKAMRTCKFLQVINPSEMPEIRVEIKYRQEEFLEVVASGTGAGNVFFKAQITYL